MESAHYSVAVLRKEPAMKYLSTNAFLLNLDKNKRYCFILGSGASISSGIPIGAMLMDRWIEEIKQEGEYTAEIDWRIQALKKQNPQIDTTSYMKRCSFLKMKTLYCLFIRWTNRKVRGRNIP